MDEIKLELNERGRGHFFVYENENQSGEMEIGINGQEMVVYHTEVKPEAEGKGYAKKMFAAMVDYARKNALKVKPLCPFVQAQFKRRPADYADIWTPSV